MTTLTLEAPVSQPQANEFVTPSSRTETRSNDIQIKGKTLIVRSGVVLPAACVRTNQPVPKEDLTCGELYGYSQLSLLLFFLLTGPFIVILFPLARRKCTLGYAVHPDVKAKYRTRRGYKMLATVVAVLAFAASAALTTSVPLIITMGCLSGVLFIASNTGNAPIRVSHSAFGKFYIKGCSEEFLQRIAAA